MTKPEKAMGQEDMDHTLEDTFPASDPPSWSTPQPHKQLKKADEESRGRPRSKSFTREDYISAND